MAIHHQKDTVPSAQPEFKPGNTPFLKYGNEMLNADVEWDQVTRDILSSGCTITSLAEEMELPNDSIQEILNRNYHRLTFKLGARLLRIHMSRQH